jgi:hypothetical protein
MSNDTAKKSLDSLLTMAGSGMEPAILIAICTDPDGRTALVAESLVQEHAELCTVVAAVIRRVVAGLVNENDVKEYTLVTDFIEESLSRITVSAVSGCATGVH